MLVCNVRAGKRYRLRPGDGQWHGVIEASAPAGIVSAMQTRDDIKRVAGADSLCRTVIDTLNQDLRSEVTVNSPCTGMPGRQGDQRRAATTDRHPSLSAVFIKDARQHNISMCDMVHNTGRT